MRTTEVLSVKLLGIGSSQRRYFARLSLEARQVADFEAQVGVSTSPTAPALFVLLVQDHLHRRLVAGEVRVAW